MKKLVAILTSWGPYGVFFLAILDSAGIPLPAAVDALVIALGAVSPESAFVSAFCAIAGSLIGSMMLFYIARKGGEAYLNRMTPGKRAQQLRAWFQTYGLISVFIPAFVPIPLPLKAFVISAGALGVRPLAFLGVVAAARIPRYLGLAWLGSQLGGDAVGWLKQNVLNLFLFATLLTVLLALVARRMAKRRHRTLT